MEKLEDQEFHYDVNLKYIYQTNNLKKNYKRKVKEYCVQYNKYLRLSVHDRCLDNLNRYLKKALRTDSKFLSLKKIKCKHNAIQ